jgi:phenylpropionate dioxygenase-like ring-hydroxylating dioxygenase large terminal subunit
MLLAITIEQSHTANQDVFLQNAWYVAALSNSIGRELTPLKLLDESVVVYRSNDGQPVVLEDACPHRKLPLSMGRLVDDHIECGYHGLCFDASGKCIIAPTQERIPPTAIVKTYPALDKYGLLWVWMGEAKADESKLLDIENFENPAWHITSGDYMDCQCNYLYLADNLLDPSHVAWVHKTSFASLGTEDTPLEMQENEQGLIVSRWIYNCEAPPFYQPLLKFSGKCDRLQHYEVRFPSIAINKSVYCPPGSGGPHWKPREECYEMISYNFLTPIDKNNTRYFWLQQRNTDPSDENITLSISKGAKQAFMEDKNILEAVHSGITNTTSRPINLALDTGALRFRTLLQQIIEAENLEPK